MELDIKGEVEMKYVASADSATTDTTSADTASDDTVTADTSAADTSAAEPPQKPLRGGRYAGG